MRSISRGAVVAAFITFTVPLYCGSLWYIWPCRHTVVGRELREVTLMRAEHHSHGCQNSTSSLFMRISESGKTGLLQTGTEAGDVGKQAKSHFDSTPPAFVNPFEGDWDSALNRGLEYDDALAECAKKDIVQPGYSRLAAYHKAERVKTAKAILADPDPANSKNEKICPRTASETEEYNAYAAENQNELDAKVKEVKDILGCVEFQEDCRLLSSVHVADMHNAMRKIFGKTEYPMDADFIATNWVPIVNKLHKEAKKKYKDKYGKEGSFTFPAAHTFLVIDQLEKFRTELNA